jgi:glucosylceramidase
MIPEGEVCLTTGWPFLQVGAFDTSAAGLSKKTVVILNESRETANFVMKNGGEIIMSSSIPPQSIQTVSYD